MSNHYRAVHPSYVAIHGEDVFDHEFATARDEKRALDRGFFEIVPRRYKVVGPHKVFDTAFGDTFEAAFTMDEESLLINAGHVVRVGGPSPKPDPDPDPPKSRKSAVKAKE